jgi:hypothetical protein
VACLALVRERARVRAPLVVEIDPEVRAELEREGFAGPSRSDARWLSVADVPDEALRFLSWVAVIESLALLSDTPLVREHVHALFEREDDASAFAGGVLARAGRRPSPEAGPWGLLETGPFSPRWISWAAPETAQTAAEASLLALVRAAGGRMPVSALGALAAEAGIEDARAHLERRIVLVHDLERETLEIEVGFLASVRLGSDPRRVRPGLVSLTAPPEARFESYLLHDDALVVLAAASRPDGGCECGDAAAAASPAAGVRLEPLPEWVARALGLDRRARLADASTFLRESGLVRGAGAPTALGRAFLARSRAERVAVIVRSAAAAEDELDSEPRCFGVPASAVLVAPLRPPHDPSVRDRAKLCEAVRDPFARLETGTFYYLDAFAAHASFGTHAALLRGAEPYRVHATFCGIPVAPFGESFELASRALLEDVVLGLVSLGGAALGLEGGRVAFALTAAGRFLLGLDAAFAAPAQDARGYAEVLPSGEVVVAATARGAVAELRLLAEEEPSPAGGSRAFRVTRGSVLGAVAAGVPAEAILAGIAHVSGRPLPEALAAAVRDWASLVRHVVLSRELVIECADADTAVRVRHELGEHGTEVPHAICVRPDSRASGRELARRLQAHGIVAREREGGAA